MIVLDTNIISEVMRPAPNEGVTAWLSAHDPLDLATTAITVAEIQRGILRLPDGKRRNGLQARFSAFIEDAFLDRLLAFDKAAAYACAETSAARERLGLHADAVDMMIAGIVKSTQATLATRNMADFSECGIVVLNPWRAKD
ncbi:MAG: type II toxin-antitoxin system VapC family toxin [Parvularculaceae bacterium]|nr:type II toxin-antitoxin system VapC family toxin [Parvularculaceae bacterium]